MASHNPPTNSAQQGSQGFGYNESAEEKRLMREQIAEARARFGETPIPWLDQVPAREFFAALGITDPPQ